MTLCYQCPKWGRSASDRNRGYCREKRRTKRWNDSCEPIAWTPPQGRIKEED